MTPRKTFIAGGISLVILLIAAILLVPSHKKSAHVDASPTSSTQATESSHRPPSLPTTSSVPVPSTTQSVSQTTAKADNSDDPPIGYGTAAPTSDGFAIPGSGLVQKYSIPPDWNAALDSGTHALALYGTPDSTKDADAAHIFSDDILAAWRKLVAGTHRSGHIDVVQAWFSQPFTNNQTETVVTGYCRFTEDGHTSDPTVGCRITQQKTPTGWQTIGIAFG